MIASGVVAWSRVKLALAAAALGLAACAAYPDATPRPEPAPSSTAEGDSCGPITAQFGQVGDYFGVGGGSDEAPWVLTGAEGRPDAAFNALLTRLRTENGQIDRVQAAYDKVTECRKASVRTIKAEVAAGRLPRSEAQLRLALIRQQYENDVRIARLIGQVISMRAHMFREAAASVEPEDARPAAAATPVTPARPAHRRPAAAARVPRTLQEAIVRETATNQAKRGSFVASVGRAEQWRDGGFQLS